MKRLTSLPLKDRYFLGVEFETMRLLDRLIYAPLVETYKRVTGTQPKLNATDPLFDAISNGTVYYTDGVFKGSFNAKIGRRLRDLGAKYSSRSNGYILPSSDVPAELRIAQASADSRYQALRDAMIKTLDNMNIDSVDDWSKAEEKYSESIEWINDDFQRAVSGVTVPPVMTAAQRQLIATQWGTNLDLYIKNWAADNILKLRKQITENTFAGRRAEDMVSLIRQNYGVGQRKAEFLARQETSLLMSKFHESRFKDIGSQSYIWSSSDDERVREDHKLLNGKIFSWDSPPVVDRRTGRTGHPGEDFGCRCVAIALIS